MAVGKRHKIDIHNYAKKEEQQIKKLKSSSLSDINKKLIFTFIKEQSLSKDLGKARKVKLMSTLRYIAEKLDKDFTKVTEKELKVFIEKTKSNEDYSIWTVIDYKKILKRFYLWLMKEGYYKNNLSVDWINTNVKQKDLPRLKRTEMITEAEAHKLIEKEENPRNKAILSLVWDAGCRIGEIGSMTISSVHFEDEGTIVDFIGKTGKRSAFVIESTPHLANWMNLHPMKDNPSAPLWINMNQNKEQKYQPMSYRAFYKVFEFAFKTAKIKKRFNPHLFRHSRALWCATNNWNQVMANKMFGWGINSSMYNYYVSLATEDLKDKMMECYGLATKKKQEVEQRKPSNCPRCKALNESKARFCYKCGLILDMETAKELMKKKELETGLHKELFKKNLNELNLTKTSDIKEMMYQVLKGDKDLIKRLREIAFI